jgi:hypothetical protein
VPHELADELERREADRQSEGNSLLPKKKDETIVDQLNEHNIAGGILELVTNIQTLRMLLLRDHFCCC